MPLQSMTECERLVMKCVWDSPQDISLIGIMEILEVRYEREWKRQTVSTFLLHLIQKGFLTSYRVGRVFYYHAEVDFEEYRRKVTGEFVEFWYGDDRQTLISNLNN